MSYCTPCPPCDTEFPLLCEPLETTANGKRLVVEDSAACQKTIQTPAAQQVLKTDGAGNLTWTNGANGTILEKKSTGYVEFATLNSVLQNGPVDLGSQPLTTTGAINATNVNTTNVNAIGTSSFKSVSVTNTGTGNGVSIQTVDGIALSIQSNNTNTNKGGSLKIFDSSLGDFVFNGATDGIFSFVNTSSAATKKTIFSGANVGIGIDTPTSQLHVAGSIAVGRQNSSSEGGEIRFCKSLDNTTGWYIDVFGSTASPSIRIVDNTSGTGIVRVIVTPNGTINLPTLPTSATGLAAGDIWNDSGTLKIV